MYCLIFVSPAVAARKFTDLFCVTVAAGSWVSSTSSTSHLLAMPFEPRTINRLPSPLRITVAELPLGLSPTLVVAGNCTFILNVLSLVRNDKLFGKPLNMHYLQSNLYKIISIPNKQWSRLNKKPNIKILLLIGGIEQNPGPFTEQQLHISHVNINSITATGRKDELSQFLSINDIKICALTETKLDDSIPSSMYALEGYHSPLTRHRTRNGGGVALYCHVSLPIKRLIELELEDEEWIWAKITLPNMTLIICCLYLPPNQTSDRLNSFLERLTESVCLAQRYSPTAILILGDFNAGNIYLNQETSYKHSGISPFDHQLYRTASTLDLEQIIHQPTRITENTQNIRDLIFTNDTQIIASSGTMSPFSNLDHFPVIVSIQTASATKTTNDTHKLIWDYSRLDSDLLIRLLLDVNWEEILNHDINEATESFINVLLDAAEKAIPRKVIHSKSHQKPWMSAELTKNIRKRDRLFKQAQRSNTKYDWDHWKYQRNMVTSLNKELKRQHIDNQVRKLLTYKRDPFKYHQTLRKITGRTKIDTIPSFEGEDGEILTDNYTKANLLNAYFAKQTKTDKRGTTSQTANRRTSSSPVPTLGKITTSEREVLQIINSLDANKSTGPDNIPVKLLKLTAVLIASPLSKLYNKSLELGIYPSKFKEANIKPIFKNKGSPSELTNYRPISLLSSLSKVFEKIVHKHLYAHLSQNNLLTDKQSGYRRDHSAEQQLLYLTHNLYKALDSGNDFTAIYLDISKYFDKIWHEGLLFKCRHEFGITDSLYNWLKSYLSDRRQRVQIGDTFSKTEIVNAGCPQGSVLGPLLALIYLDNLSTRTQNDILFFADDVSLYAPHTKDNLNKTQTSLQNDLNEIQKYGEEWAITFNTSKTIQQTFSRSQQNTPPALKFGDDIIPIRENHAHLGMSFSKDLRFHQHINEICKKVNRTLNPLYPIASYIPREILDQIYKTYTRPHFDFYDTVYDGHITIQDAHRLEVLQNRAARLVTGALFRTPTERLLRDLGWDKLKARRQMHKITLYHTFNNAKQKIPNYVKSILPGTRSQKTERKLRNHSSHTLLPHRTRSYQSSFFLSTAKLWNTLPESLRSLSHTSFKKEINKRLGVSKPPDYYTLGSKTGNILHTRLRTEMSYLNSHRFQINKTDTPECCCGYPKEDVRHYVLFCPNYDIQRQELNQNVSRILGDNFTNYLPDLQLKILIHGDTLSGEGGREMARYFQNFLTKTNRFTS